MSRFVRILAAMLLATFAAGTAAHAAMATEMPLRMLEAVTVGTEMGDCQDCPGTDGAPVTCDQGCAQSFAAFLPAPDTMAMIVPSGPDRPVASTRIRGRIGPPERHPPR